jgi:hypothetical protein
VHPSTQRARATLLRLKGIEHKYIRERAERTLRRYVMQERQERGLKFSRSLVFKTRETTDEERAQMQRERG